MKKLVLKLAVIALAVTILASAVAYAASGGSASDPLVTLSYLEEVFMPNIMSQLESFVTQKAGALEQRFASDAAAFSAGGSSIANDISDSDADTPPESGFVTVELDAGETYSAKAGTQILCVSGRVSLSGDGAACSDTTDGDSIYEGGELDAHHLYICTAPASLVAGSSAQLLVSGE